MSQRKIQGSRAIVTGASSGIGHAIALELARRGADVLITARREDRLAELATTITQAGGRVATVAGDITDDAVQQEIFETVTSTFGGLDILVNNAGVGACGFFENARPERVRTVMEVNFFSLVAMTRGALPLLKQGTAPIVVNVSSVLGHRGVPYNSEYVASKFAVCGFSESIRAEFTAIGVDVLVVSPGATATEFFDAVVEKTNEPHWPSHTPATAASVARQTVEAIVRGRHEIIPYRWGKALCWLNRLSPRFVDRLMTRYV